MMSVSARSRPERNERETSRYSRGTERAPSATFIVMANIAAKMMVAMRAALEDALEDARPATFPAEKDGANAKYARELAKYAKQPDVPGLDKAKLWLDVWEKVQARK